MSTLRRTPVGRPSAHCATTVDHRNFSVRRRGPSAFHGVSLRPSIIMYSRSRRWVDLGPSFDCFDSIFTSFTRRSKTSTPLSPSLSSGCVGSGQSPSASTDLPDRPSTPNGTRNRPSDRSVTLRSCSVHSRSTSEVKTRPLPIPRDRTLFLLPYRSSST